MSRGWHDVRAPDCVELREEGQLMLSGPTTFGGSYMRRVLIAATSILCVVVWGSGPVAFAADSSDPTFTLTPAMGPPGTHVTISGRLSPAQIPIFAPRLTKLDFFTLVADLSATCNPAAGFGCTPGPASLEGCELYVDTSNQTMQVDSSTGRVTGSFVVGSTGNCTMSYPDAATHSAPPGRYSLAISCGACQFATFTLTEPAATLPATGFPIAAESLCALGLLVLGLFLRLRRPQLDPSHLTAHRAR